MDDTLLLCSPYYVKCLEEFSKFTAERTGLTEKMCRDMLNAVDLVSTQMPDAFNAARFPLSFEAASVTLDIIRNQGIDFQSARKCYEIGESVFDAPYPLFEQVEDTLHLYNHAGYNLILCSKGDPKVQLPNKFYRHRLDRFFPLDNVHIVQKKDEEEMRKIIAAHNLNVNETIMVGDSIRDDVGMAHAVGMKAVHVSKMKPTWAYENGKNEPDYTIEQFKDLPKVLPCDVFNATGWI